jgi:hypothetical protein
VRGGHVDLTILGALQRHPARRRQAFQRGALKNSSQAKGPIFDLTTCRNFLNGVARQSEDALDRAERINRIIVEWRSAAAAGSSSRVPFAWVELLAENPFWTVKRARRGRVYCARAVLDMFEEPAHVRPAAE